MPEAVFASQMTLEAGAYLRTSGQVEKTNLQLQATMQQISARILALQNAFRPLNAITAQADRQFMAVRAGLTSIGASSAPVQGALSQTAKALAGLSGSGAQSGLDRMAASLSEIANQADAAGVAMEGLGRDTVTASDQMEQSQPQEGEGQGEKQEGAGPMPSGAGRQVSTTVGAAVVAAGQRRLGPSDEVKELKEVVDEEKRVEAATNQLRDSMGRFSGAAQETVAPLRSVAAAEAKAGEAGMAAKRGADSAAAGLGALGGVAARVGMIIKSALVAMPEVAAVVAVFAGVGEAVGKIREIFSYGDQLNALSRQTGETATSLAQLRRTFEYFDVSADAVGTTLFMLQRSLGGVSDSGEPTNAAFARIGLSIASLKQMNAPEQFAAIQAGLAKLPTQADRASTAMKIFGRSALEVQAVLNADPADFAQSMKDSEDYASTMGRNADAFEEVERKFFVFRERVEDVFAHIASGLLPIVQRLLTAVDKIDFSKWGRGIEIAIRMATAAFSSGKLGEMIELTLTVAFKEAINVMYGAIFGIAGAMQAEFRHLPALLRDSFSMLTSPEFWKGIGELMLGGFMSIQGRLSRIFIQAADGLANRIADALDHIPFLTNTVERLRSNLNAFARADEQVVKKEAHDGDAMVAAGSHNISGASRDLVGDYFSTIKDEIKAFMGAYKANKAFDIGPEMQKLQTILSGLKDSVMKDSSADPTTKTAPGAAGRRDFIGYKAPEGDRLARMGLFVGSSPASPGLSEARRTATATERMSKTMDQLLASSRKGISGYNGAVYAD